MAEDSRYPEAVNELRRALSDVRETGRLAKIAEGKAEVSRNLGPLFTSHHVDQLTEEEFKKFLKPSENKHWSSLARAATKAVKDMRGLRGMLMILLDETKPVAHRLDELRPNGKSLVPGVGRAVLTAILQIAYPDRYGVWNGTSEKGLMRLGLLPEFGKVTFGERYKRVNSLLLSLARSVEVDLWTLDTLWWHIKDIEKEAQMAAEIAQEEVEGYSSNPKIRKAVEQFAMQLASEHYRAKGFDVDESKHRTEPYDIECKKEGLTLHVEVKGTQGSGKKIILTSAEIRHAEAPGRGVHMHLFLVRNVHVTTDKSGKSVVLPGKQKKVVDHSWNPRDEKHKLECISYRCELGKLDEGPSEDSN